MDFLKEILGEELFNQVAEKINAHNDNESNKDNQIKVGNLGKGEYVAQGKFAALQEALNGKDAELQSANDLISQLKKDTRGNADLQGKIGDYEAQVADLQAQLQDTKVKSAIKVALLSEKAVDVDYLTFKLHEKLQEKGETLELDENDNIKGWEDKLSGLKTQFPTMFESASADGYQVVGDNRLPDGDGERNSITKEQFEKIGYKSRVELRTNNPELYAELSN